MHENYRRDLDLNLLRVFCVVAEAGSVTGAAARLYLTQPAVSAALRRLTLAVGAPLFVRQGRRLVLSNRGSALRAKARRTRCSVASFSNIPAIVEGSALLATVPRLVALDAVARRPALGLAELPFQLAGASTELLWPAPSDDDDACAFLRQCVIEAASELSRKAGRLRT